MNGTDTPFLPYVSTWPVLSNLPRVDQCHVQDENVCEKGGKFFTYLPDMELSGHHWPVSWETERKMRAQQCLGGEVLSAGDVSGVQAFCRSQCAPPTLRRRWGRLPKCPSSPSSSFEESFWGTLPQGGSLGNSCPLPYPVRHGWQLAGGLVAERDAVS